MNCRAVLFLVLALLTGCGGSPAPAPEYMPPATQALRRDLFFGYYLTFNDQAQKTAGEVNLVHESGWFGADLTAASMQAHGKPTMLDVTEEAYFKCAPRADLEERVAATFNTLRAAAVLRQVKALYPVDEPETCGLSDAAVTDTSARIRKVAARYPELAGVNLAVIYTDWDVLPGFASYDWIGMDSYGMGSSVLISAQWLHIMSLLRADQRALLVPGGADPWRQDPEAFRRYAQQTPQVIGIIAFMWSPQLPGTAAGIGTNGMAPAYRAVGQEISGAGK